MNIKEYKLMRNDDRLPYLSICSKIEYCNDIFNSPYEIANLMVELYNMNELFIEHLYVLGFDSRNRILGIVELSHQSDVCTPTPVKEMFTSLLLMGANNYVLVHNHPNNILEASKEDISIIHELDILSNTIGIKLRDSIIIGDEDLLSIRESLTN